MFETQTWENSRALGTDVAAAVRGLKRGDGPDLVTQGSRDLVHQRPATDPVDERILRAYPVLLGRGKRLFDDRAGVGTPAGTIEGHVQGRAGQSSRP